MITDKLNSTNRNKCTGCHACASICPVNCIDMLTDKEGFWYPEVSAACIECGKCIDVCHLFNTEEVTNEPIALACINKNPDIRSTSSSGGVFYELSKYILSQGGLVYGARFNANFDVVHSCVSERSDLKKLQGSKYVQSKIGAVYKQIECNLKNGRKVLFSGTPCQVGGLKTFLQKPYESLICVDLVCHGVPSPTVWRSYLDYQASSHGSAIEDVAFRVKASGWREHALKLVFKDQQHYQQPVADDLYLKAFLKNICLRPSCYTCDFKSLNRASDLTLADFWGIEHIAPELDDNQGTSLIFINSPTGKDLFDHIQASFTYKEVDIKLAVKYNPSAQNSAKPHPNRAKFLAHIPAWPFDEVVRSYCRDSVFVKSKRKIRKLAITILDELGIKSLIKSALAKS